MKSNETNNSTDHQTTELNKKINPHPSLSTFTTTITPSLPPSPPQNNNPSSSSSSYYYTIRTGPKGRGLFATTPLPPFQHLHTAPCILISHSEYQNHAKYTILEHYLFNTPDGDRLLALGDGSLFNHCGKRPNVDYRIDKERLEIRYSVGYREVKEGEELCICYGSGDLWFDDVDDGGTEEKEGGRGEEDSDDEGEYFMLRIGVGDDDDDGEKID